VQFIACIGGLPREAAAEIAARSPAPFTGAKDNLPIVRAMKPPYAYRPGMSDYYLGEMAKRLEGLPPKGEVGIALAYANYGPSSEQFVRAFFPYAAVAQFEPFYPEAHEKHRRRAELLEFIDRVQTVVTTLRQRVAVMRDTLSGQNFSPLTLPLRNFQSGVLHEAISSIFTAIATAEDLRGVVNEHCASILAKHPLMRIQDGRHRRHQPYFQDDRSLRFKSPGKDRHGMARLLTDSHEPACLINSRARLGGPFDALFHYDCDYGNRRLDINYPNCHGEGTEPCKPTHVNIAPSDAIR
jgi:hypothetical protein